MKIYLLLAFMLLTAPASAAPPTQKTPPWDDPNFQEADAEVALVVATVRRGAYFPAPIYPDEPNVVRISLSRSFWFRAQPASVLNGQLGRLGSDGEIEVASSSHWGMEHLESVTGPALFPVLTHGRYRVMPKYAMAPLLEGARGALFVPVLSRNMLYWLPCSVEALKEEIDPAYVQRYRITPDQYKAQNIERYPELYRQTEGAHVPRYGIAVSAIEQHLGHKQMKSADLACEDVAKK